MVDNFALFVPHAVLLIALWRLIQRSDLDREGPEEPRPGQRREPPRA
ncbi:MAG: hypothetical protein ACKOQ3_13725 [Novosphingobium sp.]